jgi:hypothetical protein
MTHSIRTIVAFIVAYFAASAIAQTASPAAAPTEPTPSVSQTANASTAMAKAADTGSKLTLMFSPYTHHFTPKPSHRHVYVLGVEREDANEKLDGIVLFRNSFGQPSIYVYPFGGVYKSVLGVNKLSFKWTAGLIYGYKGEFKNEVANLGGLAPVIIPALAYELQPGWSLQLNLLGKAAAQIQLNAPLN